MPSVREFRHLTENLRRRHTRTDPLMALHYLLLPDDDDLDEPDDDLEDEFDEDDEEDDDEDEDEEEGYRLV